MADSTFPEGLETVVPWLSDESGMTMDDAGLVTIAGEPPLELQLTTDDQRLVITHISIEPGAGVGRADTAISAVPDRGTTLHVAASVDHSGVTITLTNHVYVDGLSRQSFMTAINELVAAIDTVGGAPEAETRLNEPVPAGVIEIPEASSEVSGENGNWAATHRVPPDGMRAWAEPDPAQQPLTRLEPRVELMVTEQRGDWALTAGSNGWTGWVDARRLLAIEIGREATTSQATNTGITLRPLPAAGGIALLLSAFLPWVSGLRSVNSLDVALSFLWDLNAAGAPYLGWAIIAIAVLALAVGTLNKSNPLLMTVLGALAVAITGGFLVQMYRGITDSGGTLGDVFDFLGIAPWVSLAAGVLLIASSSSLKQAG